MSPAGVVPAPGGFPNVEAGRTKEMKCRHSGREMHHLAGDASSLWCRDPPPRQSRRAAVEQIVVSEDDGPSLAQQRVLIIGWLA